MDADPVVAVTTGVEVAVLVGLTVLVDVTVWVHAQVAVLVRVAVTVGDSVVVAMLVGVAVRVAVATGFGSPLPAQPISKDVAVKTNAVGIRKAKRDVIEQRIVPDRMPTINVKSDWVDQTFGPR